MASLGDMRQAAEVESLREQLNRYRTAALMLYGPLKVMVNAMPTDACGKKVWTARLNVFKHAFDIRY
jgi:hypothetical protein